MPSVFFMDEMLDSPCACSVSVLAICTLNVCPPMVAVWVGFSFGVIRSTVAAEDGEGLGTESEFVCVWSQPVASKKILTSVMVMK